MRTNQQEIRELMQEALRRRVSDGARFIDPDAELENIAQSLPAGRSFDRSVARLEFARLATEARLAVKMG
jgi:hypothetical protein